MMCLLGAFTFLSLSYAAYCQTCPHGWEDFRDSCYKFTRAPLARDEAQDNCRAYNSDLVAINTLEENNFIIGWLRENDPQHRRWYTSGRDDGDNVWIWDTDGSLFSEDRKSVV
uniref:U67-Liphistoxin-Lsp1a_1 n=1 Tax=Liphistius sp. SGP-2016 TaxID=1905180 RepID=A0A4Q8K403_9ARAC